MEKTKSQQYVEFKEKYDQLKTELRALGKEAFKEMAIELFAKFPELENFGFRAYTPYFNDGDECVYRVYGDKPYINNENEFLASSWRKPKEFESWQHEAAQCVSALVDQFEDELIRDLFGDHIIVTVHRDGKVQAEYYDHE